MRFDFADCTLDTDTLVLTRAGAPVAVEPQVFDLLLLLAQHSGRVVSQDEMIAAVWGGRIVLDSAISARIAAARKAVGDDGKRQAVIRTVARRGLTMAAPVSSAPVEREPCAVDVGPEARPRVRYTRNGEGHVLAYTACGTGTPVLRIGAR